MAINVVRSLLCAAALASSALLLDGCNYVGPTMPSPPLAGYEQAWMSAHALQMDYVSGRDMIGYEPAIMTIPGRPFIAKRDYKEWTREGGDEHPVHETTVTIARDKRGRIHYESSRSSQSVDVMISDPVAHIQYRYFVSSRPGADMTAQACDTRDIADATPAGLPASRLVVASYTAQSVNQNPLPAEERSELGTRESEGLLLYGQQTVSYTNSPKGMKMLRTERWFSPDLGLNVITVKNFEGQNPFSQTTRDIQFIEPDAALFQVPSTYQLPNELVSCAHRR